MWYEVKEVLSILGFLFLGVLVVFLTVGLISAPMIKYDCSRKSELYNIESKYDIISGCFVKNGDMYVPLKLYEKSMMEITNVNVMTSVGVE